jgi:ferrous iron transport protein A
MTFVVDQAAVPLAALPVGRPARLCAPEGVLAPRLAALGFVPGTQVMVVRRAPFGGPVELELRGYRICLRVAQLTGLRAVPDAGGAP